MITYILIFRLYIRSQHVNEAFIIIDNILVPTTGKNKKNYSKFYELGTVRKWWHIKEYDFQHIPCLAKPLFTKFMFNLGILSIIKIIVERNFKTKNKKNEKKNLPTYSTSLISEIHVSTVNI